MISDTRLYHIYKTITCVEAQRVVITITEALCVLDLVILKRFNVYKNIYRIFR